MFLKIFKKERYLMLLVAILLLTVNIFYRIKNKKTNDGNNRFDKIEQMLKFEYDSINNIIQNIEYYDSIHNIDNKLDTLFLSKDDFNFINHFDKNSNSKDSLIKYQEIIDSQKQRFINLLDSLSPKYSFKYREEINNKFIQKEQDYLKFLESRSNNYRNQLVILNILDYFTTGLVILLFPVRWLIFIIIGKKIEF